MDDKIKIIFGIVGIVIIGYFAVFQFNSNFSSLTNKAAITIFENELQEAVIPSDGIILPVRWGDFGSRMVKAGVIDEEKFRKLYMINGKLDEETEKLLSGIDNGNIKINSRNSGVILNLLWALGLGNKNKILEEGPMADPRYGGADKFASTGGWTLSVGDAMWHYSKHSFVALTPEWQVLVEEVSKNIYRPCCGNSTYFPDCNHGMAMLALLELMTEQGVSESEMYRVALQVNSYWFPDTYLTIAKYLKEKKNISWTDANPKEILGADYSSASGYQRILSEVAPPVNTQGGSCGV